jgi:hypothetical protein
MGVYNELRKPVINLPSKNYHFDSNMMDKLPKKGILKVCSYFKNISSEK